MAELVKYLYGTEAEILALEETDKNWFDRAFYYPSDKSYFYQAIDGVMKKYGSTPVEDVGVGVKLNNKVIGGSKSLIESFDVLTIPENFEYNPVSLHVEGTINSEGTINILH